MWRAKWVVLWSLWAAGLVRQPTAPVSVSNGRLRGSVANSGSHKEFLNIPYATLVKRFQAPGPEPTWTDTFEAIDETTRCRQTIALNSPITIGQEECQTLNVYTPLNVHPNKPLPVMVFIHGGGFFSYSAARLVYGPEFLTSKGIILVTINYRLNIQGFVCLRIKEAPGNAGMKDQVAALRWVQRNIKAFGGDPDNVTIFGESAGGAAVSFHVLSQMSKGLFHKAIVQSGSSLASWAFQYSPIYLASLLAKTMGFESMDPNALYNFFMTESDSDLIVTRVPRLKGNSLVTELLYTPCPEIDIEGEEPFLTGLPYDLLSKGNYNKVPIIIGTNTQEGLLLTEMDKLIEQMAVETIFPKDLRFPSNESRKIVADKLSELYFDNEDISLKNRTKLAKLTGDVHFQYPVSQEIELLVKTNDQAIYSYSFGYDSPRNIPKFSVKGDLWEVRGATHADELFYLFKQPMIPAFFGMEMVEKMSTMWTNFAKYGNPTPSKTDLLPVQWQPTTADNLRSFLIDTEFSTTPMWNGEGLRYWKHVYSKYRRKL